MYIKQEQIKALNNINSQLLESETLLKPENFRGDTDRELILQKVKIAVYEISKFNEVLK